MKTKLMILTAALGLAAVSGRASLIYTFTDKGGIFDGLTSLTVSISPTLNMTVTGSGTLNDNNTGIGVSDDQIDGTSEFIELTFDDDVDFLSIEFGGVGSDSADGASLTIGSGSPIILHTGVSNFAASPDIYTAPTPVTLAMGEKITITGSSVTSSFDLENITVIPEPSSLALLTLAGLAVVGISRARRK